MRAVQPQEAVVLAGLSSQTGSRADGRSMSSTATGCFFWESDCAETDAMCGKEAIIGPSVLDNKCQQFVYVFNHAFQLCSMDKKLDKFRDCFWGELPKHLIERDQCDLVCEDSHGSMPRMMEQCETACVHVHDCVDECNNDKYKYRDPISTCFEECMRRSPVSPVGTCDGSCGKHSPNMKCRCDPSCVYLDDCCKDYDNFCNAVHMKPNQTLPTVGESFPPPQLNVSAKDLDKFGKKHAKNGYTADISEDLDKKVQAKLCYGKECRMNYGSSGMPNEELSAWKRTRPKATPAPAVTADEEAGGVDEVAAEPPAEAADPAVEPAGGVEPSAAAEQLEDASEGATNDEAEQKEAGAEPSEAEPADVSEGADDAEDQTQPAATVNVTVNQVAVRGGKFIAQRGHKGPVQKRKPKKKFKLSQPAGWSEGGAELWR